MSHLNSTRKKRKNNIAPSKCRNPFHFLKRYRNLSNTRETKCPCSKAVKETKEMPNQQISRFFHVPLKQIKPPSESRFRLSRTDKIRAQHDRGKKHKGLKLTNARQRNIKLSSDSKFTISQTRDKGNKRKGLMLSPTTKQKTSKDIK